MESQRLRVPFTRPQLSPEICVCAAARSREGNIFLGHRHRHCFIAMSEEGQTSTDRPTDIGFWTTRGRMVTGVEAVQLQFAAGIPSAREEGYSPANGLTTEDLYPRRGTKEV